MHQQVMDRVYVLLCEKPQTGSAHQPPELGHHYHNEHLLLAPTSNVEVQYDHPSRELLFHAGYCWIPQINYDAAAPGVNNPWTIFSINAGYTVALIVSGITCSWVHWNNLCQEVP
jgi:hypothetical protein